MIESLLTVKNLCWDGNTEAPTAHACAVGWNGRFSFATANGARVRMTRDRLGLNKLFFAIRGPGRAIVANYLIDLVERGVPFEDIYSVPAGCIAELDLASGTLSLSRFADVQFGSPAAPAPLEAIARDIRRELEGWFQRFGPMFAHARVCVCLSGGIDSALIAALAREYFTDVTAYTYVFHEDGVEVSEDAIAAERLARHLRMPLRLVPASAGDVLDAVADALRYGQDWRDFNVHCAIVNELVARAIRADASAEAVSRPTLVLTGDLANEFLADYSAVEYRGREYYRLPAIDPEALRATLIRGLDAGDREVGVFSRHGLDLLQPYSFVVDQYLKLPGRFLRRERAKAILAKAIIGDRLPAWIFKRTKVRAQIGSAQCGAGILPVLLQAGRDAAWLKRTFCGIFNVASEPFLDRFIRAGRYRTLGFPDGRIDKHVPAGV